MCGICGIYGFEDKNLVKNMCNSVRHRGPDDVGTFFDTGIGLGNRRLSIIDLEGGHQPMHNEDESIWVTYNGEIYNYVELRGELKNHDFYTSSDTEVVIHLYEEYGDSFVKKLRAMFALAIWDSNLKKLILARDSRGIKPLYYTICDGSLLFASEIKALLEYEEFKRGVSLIGVDQFLTYRSTIGGETLFQDIKSLLPGHLMIVQEGSISIEKYWDLRMNVLNQGEEVITGEIRNLLEESIRDRLMSDVPLGAFLSGGIDSSTIVGIMSKLVDKPIKTFTAGFEEENDDFRCANLIAEHFNTDHRTLLVDYEEMTKYFPKIIWHMDEPVADPAMLPFYFASKLAREQVKVALVGEGADELFAGYMHHGLASRYTKIIPEFIRKKMLLRLNVPISRRNRGELYAHRLLQGKSPDSQAAFKKALAAEGDLLNKTLLWEIKNILPKYQLIRVDKMSMAHSLEARVPFLDQRLIEYSAKIPPYLKMNGFNGKYILKRAMYDFLPKEILTGKKRIFSAPLHRWFDNGLSEVAQIYLDDSTMVKHGFFTQEGLHKIFNRQKRTFRRETYSYSLWSLLMLEIWFRIFIDRENL
jgi:asparagine synthase (glutamine-hydrolysing)